MKAVTQFCLILLLLVLFSYQSWKTIIKYQAGKTSLQVCKLLKNFKIFHCNPKVTISDAGSILFPSMTICKDEMFDNLKSLERGLLTEYEKVSSEMAESWFRNRTFSRARLVKFLSIKTVTGSDSNNYPCNAVSGPKARYIRAPHWSSPYINTALSLVQKLEIFSQCSPIVEG